jgi:cell division protein FtsX
MLIIKPLEAKSNRPMLFKALFLVTLVMVAILLDKIFLKKSQDISGILGQTQEIKLQTQERIVKEVQESNLVKDSIKKAEEVSGIVLGEATNTLNKLTSDAGSLVSDVIYNNSIGRVVEQIDKLPEDQQEKIREEICK